MMSSLILLRRRFHQLLMAWWDWKHYCKNEPEFYFPSKWQTNSRTFPRGSEYYTEPYLCLMSILQNQVSERQWFLHHVCWISIGLSTRMHRISWSSNFGACVARLGSVVAELKHVKELCFIFWLGYYAATHCNLSQWKSSLQLRSNMMVMIVSSSLCLNKAEIRVEEGRGCVM